MADLVFFYGTLMTPFNRTGRRGLDQHLEYKGRGTIEAALFDLGIYPAAVPADDGRVWGEVYQMSHPVIVLRALDEIEGYSPTEPESSLYRRKRTMVTMEDGTVVFAAAYFYNAPLGRAERIASGDYLQHLRVRD
ncbi:MAG TPA: gamma-glutamylcyclotransferase family protein [Vicinamibacterales bacterium]|nr:gamma-glutamylcyclotransferase family protein [Vicinamibacterales bacterium]